MLNGDTFCLMQGRGDPRGAKGDIRPEHKTNTYFDSVIDDAIDWFSPYAHLITVVGKGNHETSVIKHHETDVIKRFVDGLNAKNGTNVQSGEYGGWITVKLKHQGANCQFRIKYFHGSGGGGIVTKGAINITRALEMYEGMDVFTMGHIHENSARNDVRETLDGTSKYRPVLRTIHSMLTGTYKEEYNDGKGGFHVERGAPPKPLGGRILDLSFRRAGDEKKGRHIVRSIDSYQFRN